MQLSDLRVNDFRAHPLTRIGPGDKVNLLAGDNGVGKTNLIEAVHYLCLSKSFLTTQDQLAVRRDADFFEVQGLFVGERRPSLAVRLVYVPGEGKRIMVNGAPLDRLSDIVGMLPVVLLSPEDYVLTAGGPEERRRFLDNTLSQSRPAYLEDLLRYRRALKQRNALLHAARARQGLDTSALSAWTTELVRLGARIIHRRHGFLKSFGQFLEQAYRRIEAVGEEPTLRYDAAVTLPEDAYENEIAEALEERLARLAARERERGRTLAGPHRDEVVFMLNGFEVRPYASQGQHRTFALALKLATFFYLKEHLQETPLLLFDDVFGILDARRSRVVLDLLQGPDVGQSILTAARREPFEGVVDWSDSRHRSFNVRRDVSGAAVVESA